MPPGSAVNPRGRRDALVPRWCVSGCFAPAPGYAACCVRPGCFDICMTTNTPIAEAMEPYLATGDQNRSGAETSIKINIDLWRKHLEGFPLPADIRVRSDGTITRGDLVRLAEVARREGTDESVMDLFWTVLAWGLAGSWRNVGRLVADVRNDVGGVITALRESSAAAYAGDPGTGFEILHRRVDRWGPAYFTKFLHFSADFDDPAQGSALDSRQSSAGGVESVRWRVARHHLREGLRQLLPDGARDRS